MLGDCVLRNPFRYAGAGLYGWSLHDRQLALLVGANAAVLATFVIFATSSAPHAMDGLGPDSFHYLWISKTLYHGWESVHPDPGGQYFAFSHFPFYPIVVGAVAEVLCLGRVAAGHAVTIACSSLALVVFYRLAMLRGTTSVLYPLLLIATNYEVTLQSIFVSYVPMLMLLVFATFLYLEKEQFGRSALLAGLAQATHIVAWALLPACLVSSILKGRRARASFYLSVPAALGLIFALFWLRSGDFWAFVRYNAGHPYHRYFPFSTLWYFMTASAYSIWQKALVAFSLATMVVGLYLLLRAREYGPATLGLLSLLAASSMVPASCPTGLLRYSMPAMTCLLGFTAMDLEKRRFALPVIGLLSGLMYAYAFQSVLTYGSP